MYVVIPVVRSTIRHVQSGVHVVVRIRELSHALPVLVLLLSPTINCVRSTSNRDTCTGTVRELRRLKNSTGIYVETTRSRAAHRLQNETATTTTITRTNEVAEASSKRVTQQPW
jgi:hypothetical protein